MKIKKEIAFVCAITLIALVLRLIALTNMGTMWHDELYSWYFASRDSLFLTTFKEITEDIHMPLYFMLLHFWIKLFGDNTDVMRLLSLILSLPLIPAGYFAAKKLFSKQCAIYSSIFLTLNTFIIYYSLEIRIYSLVLPLSLIAGYYFAKSLFENKNKDCFFYVLSMTLLFYTFTITPVLALSYFIVGLIYLIFNNKGAILKFLLSNIYIFVLSLPAILIILYNAIALNNNLVSYPLDLYHFKPAILWDIIENTFTFKNEQIITNFLYSNCYQHLIYRLWNFNYIIFVFAPAAIALIELTRAVFTRNKQFGLFFYPSFLFVIIIFLLAAAKYTVLQTRYMVIITPVFIVSFCYGFSVIKKRVESVILFTIFIVLGISNIFFWDKYSVYTYHRTAFLTVQEVIEKLNVADDDLLLIPHVGNKVYYYIKKGNCIPFSISNAAVLKDKKSLNFYFGKDAKNLTRDNVKEYLLNNIKNDIIQKSYEENLYNTYLKNLKHGQRVILMTFTKEQVFFTEQYRKNCERFIAADCIMYKATRDSFLALNKYLKLIKSEECGGGGHIWVFEKTD